MAYIVDRRKFLQISGTLAGAAFFNPALLYAKEDAIIRFGIVTDSHYADREPAGTRYYRESLAKMIEAMEEMNKLNVNFVIHLGDFKDEGSNPTEETTLLYLRKQEEAFATFKGPRYHVFGNHDADSISKQQFLDNVRNTGIVKDKSYYTFDNKGFHFVVLDADFKNDGSPYDKGNFVWTDSFIPQEQLQWLRDDLAKTKFPVIVFVHQLLDDVNDHDFCVKNAKQVRNVLQESKKVIAVFQGHRHEERYNKMEGIHYCTLPGMVDYSGLENNSFSLAEIYKGGDISMTGYKRAPSRKMQK